MSRTAADAARRSPPVRARRPVFLEGVAAYVLSALLVAVALGTRDLLTPVLGTQHAIYTLPTLAVTIIASLAGFRVAFFSTLVGAFGVNILFYGPRYALSPDMTTAEATALLLFLITGTLIGWLGSNRFMALREARATATALAEREAQLRTLSDNLPGTMVYQMIAEPDGTRRFVYVSGNIERLNGVTAEQVYADPTALYRLILPDDVPELARREEQAVRDRTHFEQEVRMLGPGGRERWVLLSSSPRSLDDGSIVWDGVQIDVTERREAQEALRRTNEDLEARVHERTAELVTANQALWRSNAELERFAYVASHDLQEPLRTVSSFAGMLERRYTDQIDDQGRRIIAMITGGAERMKRLVDDLLRFSRVSGTQVVRRPVETAVALHEALDRLDASLRESEATVTHDPMPVVLGDGGQLTQLFQNLIGNAVKFRRDGVPPAVHVDVRRDGDFWHLCVRDNGIGIAPRYHERIFEIFQRLHPRDRYEGTGVGLAICKRIVELHGGQLSVESDEGRGSSFHFRLPAAPDPT